MAEKYQNLSSFPDPKQRTEAQGSARGQAAVKSPGIQVGPAGHICPLLAQNNVREVSRPEQHTCEMSFLQLKFPAPSIWLQAHEWPVIGSLKGRLLRLSIPNCLYPWTLHEQLQTHPPSLKEQIVECLLLCLIRLGSGDRASNARSQSDLQCASGAALLAKVIETIRNKNTSQWKGFYACSLPSLGEPSSPSSCLG